jgi:hypothetical protein
MEVLLLAVMGLTNIACFIIGAKVGQAVAKGEKIETPTVNPMKAYREHEAKKVAQAEQDKIAVIMGNIEAYDGTSSGQKDVPR